VIVGEPITGADGTLTAASAAISASPAHRLDDLVAVWSAKLRHYRKLAQHAQRLATVLRRSTRRGP
jgi:hypothetical protein